MDIEIVKVFFDALEPAFWVLNGAMLAVAICMRQMEIPKFGWAIFGVILMVCAGIAVKISTAVDSSQVPLSLVLIAVTWGALGARFLGNWLTDRAS